MTIDSAYPPTTPESSDHHWHDTAVSDVQFYGWLESAEGL